MKKNAIIYSGMGIVLSMILLLTSVEIVAFNLNHYRKSFIQYNITEVTGMDLDNLMYTIEDLLVYLGDERELLDTRAIVRGEERAIFGEREVLHMVDVKELFIKGRLIRNGSLILFLLLLFLQIKRDNRWKRNVRRTMMYTALGNIFLLLLLLLLMYVDFYKYFTYFHLIFFDNDLWILDPNTDILLQMVPEAFFYNTAVKIVGYFMGSLFTLAGIAYFLEKRNK